MQAQAVVVVLALQVLTHLVLEQLHIHNHKLAVTEELV
jgi:hypothetical protein